jgi:hypothetical protein
MILQVLHGDLSTELASAVDAGSDALTSRRSILFLEVAKAKRGVEQRFDALGLLLEALVVGAVLVEREHESAQAPMLRPSNSILKLVVLHRRT